MERTNYFRHKIELIAITISSLIDYLSSYYCKDKNTFAREHISEDTHLLNKSQIV